MKIFPRTACMIESVSESGSYRLLVLMGGGVHNETGWQNARERGSAAPRQAFFSKEEWPKPNIK